MLPPSGLCCRLIPLGELTHCLQWALPRYRIDRASWILSQVTQRVQSGRSSEIIAGTASQCSETGTLEHLLAAAIAIEQAAGAATLLLLQAVSAEELQRVSGCDRQDVAAGQGTAWAADAGWAARDAEPLIRPLLEPVLQRLRALGVTFLQAACDEPSQAALLRAAGLEPLADLSLMALASAGFAEATRVAAAEAAKDPSASTALQWAPLDAIGEDWEDEFSSVAAGTFIDTPDCPRLSDFRTADDIVAGYRAAPTFDRGLSKLLRVEEQWAGCLVLTRHETHGIVGADASDSESTVALELTYMGLKPEFRGRGLAACLLAETLRVATRIGAEQILLAVDQANQPARASYQRLGWQDVAHESVWGRRV